MSNILLFSVSGVSERRKRGRPKRKYPSLKPKAMVAPLPATKTSRSSSESDIVTQNADCKTSRSPLRRKRRNTENSDSVKVSVTGNQYDHQEARSLFSSIFAMNAYKCHTCEVGFAHVSSLKVHMLTHSTSHSCKKCGEEFTDISNYYSHKKAHMKEDRRKKSAALICDICGKAVTSNRTLTLHKRMHIFEDNAPDDIEDDNKDSTPHKRRVKRKRGQVQERNSEQDASPTINLLTNMSFSPKVNQYTAVTSTKPTETDVTRNGRYAYMCMVCYSEFTFAHELREHAKTHNEDDSQRYLCTQCGKTFSQESTLQLHANIHNDDKPYR